MVKTLEHLQELERKQRKAALRDRVRFLRLLKSKIACSQQQAVVQLEISLRQAQRYWRLYQQQGIKALVAQRAAVGFGKLSAYQISRLQAHLRTDQVSSLADAQQYIAQQFGICYRESGICMLFQRLGIKLKTGRPPHLHQPAGAIETFKKIRNAPGRLCRYESCISG